MREELLQFVEVLLEDEDLRAWFESLEGMPALQRSEEFAKITARMRAAGEHPELIQATALLAEEKIYQGVHATVSATRKQH